MPHLKADYFSSHANRAVFTLMEKYTSTRGAIPTKEILHVELQQAKGINETTFKEARGVIDSLAVEKPATDHEVKWLIDTAEEFCKQRALYLALAEAAVLTEKAGEAKPGEMNVPDMIPDMLADALSVGFTRTVGHDYLEDFADRFEFYHSVEEQIPFDIELFNLITKGGLPRKTLTTILAGTGVGKTLMMCHFAATNLMQGKRVLYVTLEMADKKISERIDANLMDTALDDLKSLSKESFTKKAERIKERTPGRLIVKEYPTASAGVVHFRALLKELRIKKNFVPDIIYVDYINLCVSSRYRGNSNVNSYTLVKAIAEELRGLAVEQNLPIVTATQTTRTGIGSSDVDLTDTSESIGLPYTVDLMFAAIATEEMQKAGHMMIKQLKNRFDDPNRKMRFMIGVDKSKMRLYNLEEASQGSFDRYKKDAPPPGNKPPADEPLSARLRRLG